MYRMIVFRHTWYRFALMLPSFSSGILLVIQYCRKPDMDVLYSGFWFILAVNIVALICLAYTMRYFVHLRRVRESYEMPMDEVLSSCDMVFVDCHFFYQDYLLSFDDPVKIRYKDIVHIETYHKHKKRRHYYYLYLYTKDHKQYTLRTFHKHPLDFYWRKNTEGETNWNAMIQLLKEKALRARISTLSPAEYARQEKRRERKRGQQQNRRNKKRS